MVTHAKRPTDAVFRALADPTRRALLGLLRQRPHTVGELAGHFRSSRPAISRHLRRLRQAGLVTTKRQGAIRMCRLNPAPLRTVKNWLEDYELFWRTSLASLQSYLETPPIRRSHDR